MKHFRFLFLIAMICAVITGMNAMAFPVEAQVTAPDLAAHQIYIPSVLKQVDIEQRVEPTLVTLESFVQSVMNSQPETIVGVYVDDVFALQVVQQPGGDPNYISELEDEVTQYDLARQLGVTGLIAHNHLAGARFFDLDTGEIVQIIYGDGSVKSYQISEISRYQAMEPASFTSSFIDLNNGEEITAAQLFTQYYMGDDHVTFQTCISSGSISNWGRIFLVATPMSE